MSRAANNMAMRTFAGELAHEAEALRDTRSALRALSDLDPQLSAIWADLRRCDPSHYSAGTHYYVAATSRNRAECKACGIGAL